jgi:hypothetical protein
MKKKIADMEPGVDVFEKSILWNTFGWKVVTIKARFVLTGDSDSETNRFYAERIDLNSLMFPRDGPDNFNGNEEYEVIGHIGQDGKLTEASE